MRSMQITTIIGVAILLVVLSISAGYVATVVEAKPPVVQVLDNERMVHTEAGWRKWSAADYANDNSAQLSAEYSWQISAVATALPITAGNCGAEQGCIEGR